MTSEIQPIASIGAFAAIISIKPVKVPRPVPAIEVGAYSIREFKLCSGTPLDDTTVIAEGFSDEMKSRGHKVTVALRDQAVSPKQWHAPTDQKPDGIDTVDMAFISTHGGTYVIDAQLSGTKGTTAIFWFAASCDSPDGCDITSLVIDPSTWSPPDPRNPVANMRLGDGKLRWLVLDTCRSLQMGTVNENDQTVRKALAKATPGRTWWRCYAGVHMLFGYTGLTHHHFSLEGKGVSFGARVGRGEVLSEAWLDEAFSSRFGDVPVATAFAQSIADVDKRLRSESLRKPGPGAKRPIDKNFFHSSTWRS